jgi:hypothetical protein
LTPNLAFNARKIGQIYAREEIFWFRRNHDSSRLAEETEEDGGQRRPEKRKKALERQESPDPQNCRGEKAGYVDATLTTFRPSYREAYHRPCPEASLQDHPDRGPAYFHLSMQRHRQP